MGQKMQNAPVYFTIAQVRYNPILSLETYLSGIQESMRKAGYPDFKKGVTMSFNLMPLASGEISQEQFPQPERVERYIFSNMDSTCGFILEQNALSFQATSYDTFEIFSDELLKGLGIVHKAVALDFSERVGVRYLDAISPVENEKLTDYLVPEVLGLSSRFKNCIVQHSFSETLVQIPAVGNVMSRSIIQSGALGFPPDLQPIGLKVADRFAKLNGVHATIDIDASFDGRETFDLGALKNRLFALHGEIINAFHATVTEHALAVWK